MVMGGISPEETSGSCCCTLDEGCLDFKTKQPLLSIGSVQEDNEPFQYNYLVGLFTAPDMARYLAQSSHNDDAPPLPIHLQRLISEVKEEDLLQHQSPGLTLLPALQRLDRVKSHIWPSSGGDIATLMVVLTELMRDPGELENILR